MRPSPFARPSKKYPAAKALAERGPQETLAQVAERAGCSKYTLEDYLKDEDFRDLVIRLTDHALVSYMPQIDRAMVAKAIKGSVPAANYIAKRAGRLEDVTRNKSLDEYLKRLDDTDRDALEHFVLHGTLPDEEGSEEPDGETVQ